VRNPTLESPEDQLSWTDRGNWTSGAEGKCMEIRYCGDINNGVEHYGGTYNVPWNGNGYGIPLVGVWHHIAITRAADGTEKLYSDGVLYTTKALPTLNLRDDNAPFALGGVNEAGSWNMLFSGSLARVRVYDGTLTEIYARYPWVHPAWKFGELASYSNVFPVPGPATMRRGVPGYDAMLSAVP